MNIIQKFIKWLKGEPEKAPEKIVVEIKPTKPWPRSTASTWPKPKREVYRNNVEVVTTTTVIEDDPVDTFTEAYIAAAVVSEVLEEQTRYQDVDYVSSSYDSYSSDSYSDSYSSDSSSYSDFSSSDDSSSW